MYDEPEDAPVDIPTREELLQDLARARYDRSISVPAIKTLLEELRREDDSDDDTGFDALDDADNVTPIRSNRKAS